MARDSKGQTGRRMATNRLTGYPFNRRDAELQSEAQFPKDPRYNDANTLTNERHPTMDLTTATKGKVGDSKKTASTTPEAWDDVNSMDVNAKLQYIHTDLNGGTSE